MNQSTTSPLKHLEYQRSRPGTQMRPTDDIVQYLKDYAREKPEAAALWCFGIGFVLGWKLKPW